MGHVDMMRNSKRQILVIGILVVLLMSSEMVGSSLIPLASSDQSGLENSPWPCFGGNAQRTGQSPYDTSHVNGTHGWKLKLTNHINSSPVIGYDGTIYVGSDNNNLYAVHPDGTTKWSFSTDGKVRSSPAIDGDGIIYVGSGDYNLYAVNPDGSMKWSFPTGDEVNSSPIIDSTGTVYVGSLDGFLYAINPNGTQKWKTFLHSVSSSPTLDLNGTIYIGSKSS